MKKIVKGSVLFGWSDFDSNSMLEIKFSRFHNTFRVSTRIKLLQNNLKQIVRGNLYFPALWDKFLYAFVDFSLRPIPFPVNFGEKYQVSGISKILTVE